jgi:hypothetical protein
MFIEFLSLNFGNATILCLSPMLDEKIGKMEGFRISENGRVAPLKPGFGLSGDVHMSQT